jgi:DNA-binding transcriptional MerR regulator
MDKSSEAFRTITEVAGNLDLPQHVLRFWETRFTQIKPLKRAGGRRYYRPEDVQLITAIRRLLYDEGFTIRGVQRLLREKGAKAIIAGAVPAFSMANEDTRSAGSAAAQAGAELINSADELLHAQNGAELHHTANGSRQDDHFEFVPRPPHVDRRALESILEELGECRRILDGALHPRS